jgi:hypothetical protein
VNVYTSLTAFWHHYFPDNQPVDQWTIAHIALDGQQLYINLANPFTERIENVTVSSVTAHELAQFDTFYKQYFVTNYYQRFGFWRSDVDKVLTEYPDWQTCAATWLASDRATLSRNLPLLFDFPSSDEYRALQLRDADFAGYRRLLVVVYQYRKQQFHKLFVQIDDGTYAALRQQVLGQIQTSIPVGLKQEVLA